MRSERQADALLIDPHHRTGEADENFYISKTFISARLDPQECEQCDYNTEDSCL